MSHTGIKRRPTSERARHRMQAHPDYVMDREPAIDEATADQAVQLASGASVVDGITRSIHRAIPGITLDQAKDAAFAVLEQAARTSGRGRRI